MLHEIRPGSGFGIKFAAALSAGIALARSRGSGGHVFKSVIHFILVLDPLISIEQQGVDLQVGQFAHQ